MTPVFAVIVGSNAALVTFFVYTLIVFGLAIVSSRLQVGKNFLNEYFLGSRSLGMWTFALTFAATSASGGSFTGFPSLIYSHGWVLALWIGSYMLVPALMMGLLGKRLNQMGRQADAITIPDVLASRFESNALGILSTLLLIFFMTFNLVAQFKAGAVMLSTLLDDVPLFQAAATMMGGHLKGTPILGSVNGGYLLCLLVFSFAVIVYTSYGGFRAVVWTDVLQGIVMLGGVLVLLPLVLYQVGGLRNATDDLAKMTPPRRSTVRVARAGDISEEVVMPFGTWLEATTSEGNRQIFRTAEPVEFARGQSIAGDVEVLAITSQHEIDRIRVPPSEWSVAAIQATATFAFGAGQEGVYVTPPGPSPADEMGFLPLGVAISFFFFWVFSGAGQPSNMVRLMSFNSSLTLRRAMMTVAIYFSLIYFPLVIIFCCSRVLLPGMEIESDRIMPELAEHVTRVAGMPWLAGLLVAAPFAAVMSTVDSFLLMISSAIVRDVYQRNVNPGATQTTLKRLTYFVTALVGVAALLGAINPPTYLQNIIVFTGGGLSACFLMPVGLALYWPRFNAPGAIASMLGGFVTHVVLYAIGYIKYNGFRPLKIAGLDPFIPELIVSFMVAVIVTYFFPSPRQSLIERFFMRRDLRME